VETIGIDELKGKKGRQNNLLPFSVSLPLLGGAGPPIRPTSATLALYRKKNQRKASSLKKNECPDRLRIIVQRTEGGTAGREITQELKGSVDEKAGTFPGRGHERNSTAEDTRGARATEGGHLTPLRLLRPKSLCRGRRKTETFRANEPHETPSLSEPFPLSGKRMWNLKGCLGKVKAIRRGGQAPTDEN